MQIGHRHLGALAVARAKAESVLQAAFHNLIGHTDVHHMRQVVFGGSLRGGQTNGRCEGTHHGGYTCLVHLLDLGRTRLRGGLGITQKRLQSGATQRPDAGFVDVFNGHQRTFPALLARVGQRPSDWMQHADLDLFGLRATDQRKRQYRRSGGGLRHKLAAG